VPLAVDGLRLRPSDWKFSSKLIEDAACGTSGACQAVAQRLRGRRREYAKCECRVFFNRSYTAELRRFFAPADGSA
jgi:hypothetical protein